MTQQIPLLKCLSQNPFNFETRTVRLNSGYDMPILGLGTYALDHDACVNSVMALLESGGRIAIITFHSLEDRIVKSAFNKAENPCICPPEFPVCVCGRRSKGKHLTKKAIVPTETETKENPRSKSSKLRIFEKKT